MNKKFVLIILVSSLLIVLITPIIIPTVANTQEDMANLKFGKPIYFIQQQSIKDQEYIESFPYWTTIENPWETPTKFLIKNFIISYSIVVGILSGLYFMLIYPRIKY